jgi:magnesium transporter
MAVNSYLLTSEKRLVTDLSPERMIEVLSAGPDSGTLWVDIEDPTPDETALLDDVFALHPLTIEDCTAGSEYPKVEDFGRYLFLVLIAPKPSTLLTDELTSVEMDICLGANFVVTYHSGGELRCVARAVEALRRNPGAVLGRGADFLFHRLVDGLVDDYFPLLDILDRETERIEDQFVDGEPERQAMARLMDIKRNVLALRRIINPHRQMLARLSSQSYEVIGDTVAVYFRDVTDHLARISSSVELYRETIYEAVQMHNSITAQHTNEVMRVFTVIAALMMFPTAIASIYGMNFDFPGSGTRSGFWLSIAVMAAMTVGLIWYFRKKKWV